MSSTHMHEQNYRRDMGDGLILRWSTAADVDQIGELYGFVFRDKADAPLNTRMGLWATDLGSGKHPLCGPNDFAVVEDTRQGSIVAATIVLQQVWQYDGVPFPVGRPEAVASHPEYRNRGLVRGLFDLFHARSAARGQLAQGITGISYFYRQFGYEYAFDLGGEQRVPFEAIPQLKEGETEPYTLRKATRADLPLIRTLYERECKGSARNPLLMTTAFDETYWSWMLEGQNPESGQGVTFLMIDNSEQQAVGYVARGRLRWGIALPVFAMSVQEGVQLAAVVPSVLRALKAMAKDIPAWREGIPEPTRLVLHMGSAHPVYETLKKDMVSRSDQPYAWYVRVPDLPALIKQIAPALERRLAGSVVHGYTGELKFDFYKGGLKLAFENGKLSTAENWRREVWGPGAQAGFPPLVFLQLLFGRRSLDQLGDAFPDVWTDEEYETVIKTLFPRQPSWAIGLD